MSEANFEDLFGDSEDELGNLMGTAEEALRRQMGDDNFDKMMYYQRANADGDLALVFAHVNRVNAVSNAWISVDRALKVGTVLAVLWSIYRWTIGRIK